MLTLISAKGGSILIDDDKIFQRDLQYETVAPAAFTNLSYL